MIVSIAGVEKSLAATFSRRKHVEIMRSRKETKIFDENCNRSLLSNQ